ncbi:MAG: cell division protein SepF [Tissierellia bacterium]|nr:cell division protein SepF [Tissierellia bacterium]
MADFIDKLKRSFGFGEDYEYEEDYDFNDFEEEEEIMPEPVTSQHKPVETKRDQRGHLVSIQTNASMVITVHEPLSYDDSPQIVDDLKADKAVVLNFEQLEMDVKREIFDFVNGALYAMEGKIQKVNKDIFILAPRAIAIEGLKEELQNSGVFPW